MIKINNVSFSYNNNKSVLKDISFDINDGECVVILGPNGVGKSTLINLLIGANKVKIGDICFENESIKNIKSKKKAEYIAYIPQLVEGNDLTVLDTVLLGRLPYFKIYPNKNDYEIANKYIDKFNLNEIKYKQTNQISGGERQIVSIVRAFIQESKLVVLDEPTNNLDISAQLRVLNLIKEEKKEKSKSFLISMHDINQALEVGDKFIFLKNGVIHKVCKKEEIDEVLIDSVYDVKSKIIDIKGKRLISYE